MKIKDKVVAFCKKEGLVGCGDRVVCCVSGGADSMTLLDIMYTCSAELDISEVICCHLNHGIRGEESDEDQRFVEAYCSQRGIRLYTDNAHMSEKEMPKGMGTEEYARNARYSFFERVAGETGANRIATGHTMNDQCETVLFRLARGTGLKGAAGIPVKRDRYIRPLMCLSREETEEYCVKTGIGFRTDSTNDTDDYARNKVRHHAVPSLLAVNDAAVSSVCSFAADAGEADAYLRKQASALLAGCRNGSSYDTAVLSEAEPIILRYAIMLMLEEQGAEADRDLVKRCAEAVHKCSRTQVNETLFFVSRKHGTFFDRPFVTIDEEKEVAEGRNVLPSGRVLEVSVDDIRPIVYRKLPNGIFNSSIDYDKVIGKIILRHRRAGDVFSSARRHCTKSLKDIFSEKKMTNEQKARCLVVCDDEGVIWLEGEGPSRRTSVSEKTEKIMKFFVGTEEHGNDA